MSDNGKPLEDYEVLRRQMGKGGDPWKDIPGKPWYEIAPDGVVTFGKGSTPLGMCSRKAWEEMRRA